MEPGAPMVPSGLHLDPVAAQALASDGPSFEGTPPPGIAAESSGFRFQDVAAEAGVRFRYTFGDYAYDNILESSGSGATWIDHDLDGDMDLYLLNGVYIEGVSDPKGMRSFGQASDHFYCNSGDGTFVDCTDRVGLGSHDWSMGAVAGDYDEDGYPDIFLATYGANRLFHNNGDGTFTDVASEAGTRRPAAS